MDLGGNAGVFFLRTANFSQIAVAVFIPYLWRIMIALPVSLATTSPSPQQRNAAAVVAATIIVAALLVMPYAAKPGPNAPVVQAIYETAVIFADFLTATLLLIQFRQLAATWLAVLGGAYLFSGLTAFVHFLSFPGLLAQEGVLGGGSQTSIYLWGIWHTLFPLAIALAIHLRHHSLPAAMTARTVAVVMAVAVGAVVVATLIVTARQDSLPILINDGRFNGVAGGQWMMMLAANAFAVISVLALGRRHSMLTLWLQVSTIALVAEVVVLWGADQRYALGWYGGRLFSLLASTVLAVAFIVENAQLLRYASTTTLQLYDALDQAVAANAAKSQFFATASHDLRQPFQAMRLFHGVLDGTAKDPTQQTIIDRLGQAMTSAESLLTELLDIAHLDSGAVKAKAKHCDAAHILGEVYAELLPVARDKGLAMRIRAPRLTVHNDPILLKRILFSLTANAIRYTNTGTVLLAVRRRAGLTVFEVWDTGIGISEAAAGKIFEELYQVNNPSRDRSHGLGLGLAIVKRLCDLLGCSVTLKSRPGTGTVFRVTLPAG
jgi:two-component system, sensor histidine kinase and response regulator